MAVFFLFLFLFLAHEAQAQTQYFNITPGSSLTTSSNSSWLSPSGLYAFGFYKESDGFAVGIFLAGLPEKTVVWTANWDEDHVVRGNATLLLTTDDRLIIQAQGREINIANINGPVVSASMLDNGNFVIYGSYRNITWQSFDHPTDTLLPGQRLVGSASQELYSRASETDYSRGRFLLVMQGDGNLVQYPADAVSAVNSYYSTGTFTAGDKITLNLEDNGHLFLLNSTVNIIMNITTGEDPKPRTIYRMRIDVDGIFRVYSHSLDKANWTQIWASTNDRCVPKGRCGLNQFCVLLDQDVSCRCLPGFDFIDEGEESSGCERNFTETSCKAVNKSASFAMQRVEKTIWENNQYSILLKNISVEDCEKKCLEDCNCDAAFFKDQECRKQRLPLRYGRRDATKNDIALIKVGLQSSIGNEASPENITSEQTKEKQTAIFIVGISLILLAILVLVISGVLFHRARKRTYKTINETQNVEAIDENSLRAFSYAELVEITDNFTEELGKGASGTVYKGTLSHSHKKVAVKKLENELEEGEKEFQTEMKVIGKTHHRNLVRLLGYCVDGPKRLLVYEFMGRGSLADVLFTSENRLSWMERVRVATEVVRGIMYLHEECETQIIHCDIKPQNILMDDNMCAKISDFGVAKLLKQDQTRTYTGLRGTKGYVAPEWHRKLPVTVKADVYSFGIVLLEIICHRKSVNWTLPEDEAVLEEWAYDCFVAGELGRLVNGEEVDMKKLERWVKVAIWCIQDEPSLRPSMKKVLLMLEGTVNIPIPPNPSSVLSSL